MSGTRPFDDGRFPDQEGFAECFLCGRKVDPKDPRRGSYEIAPAGPALPIHLNCAQGRNTIDTEILYRGALLQMADHSSARVH